MAICFLLFHNIQSSFHKTVLVPMFAFSYSLSSLYMPYNYRIQNFPIHIVSLINCSVLNYTRSLFEHLPTSMKLIRQEKIEFHVFEKEEKVKKKREKCP